MRSTILCLAALAQLALTAVADKHVTIPLYRRSPSPFYQAAGEQIDDGIVRICPSALMQRYASD